MSRFQKVVIAIVAALVVAVAIGVTLIVKQQADAAGRQAYESCLEENGYNAPAIQSDTERLTEIALDCLYN